MPFRIKEFKGVIYEKLSSGYFVAVTLIVSAVVIVNVTDADDRSSTPIDSDDYISFSSENYDRIAVSSYDSKAELFLSKAVVDDDRDKDGLSSVNNCLEYIMGHADKGSE